MQRFMPAPDFFSQNLSQKGLKIDKKIFLSHSGNKLTDFLKINAF